MATPSRGDCADSPRASASARPRSDSSGGIAWEKALAESAGVDREELPRGAENRAARGAGQQRGGVLEAASDAPAAGAAEGPLDAGDEPERRPQPASARV